MYAIHCLIEANIDVKSFKIPPSMAKVIAQTRNSHVKSKKAINSVNINNEGRVLVHVRDTSCY